jgi:hypothetical protein
MRTLHGSSCGYITSFGPITIVEANSYHFNVGQLLTFLQLGLFLSSGL